ISATTQRSAGQPSIQSQLPEMIGFWLPWIQVRSCASVGWCGILSLNLLITTMPEIQRPTARTAGMRSGRFFIGVSLFRSEGDEPASGAYEGTGNGKDEECKDEPG